MAIFPCLDQLRHEAAESEENVRKDLFSCFHKNPHYQAILSGLVRSAASAKAFTATQCLSSSQVSLIKSCSYIFASNAQSSMSLAQTYTCIHVTTMVIILSDAPLLQKLTLTGTRQSLGGGLESFKITFTPISTM